MKYTTLKDLATELKMDKSALRKHCVKRNVEFTKVRTRESNGQAMLAVDEETAAMIRKHYAWRFQPNPTGGEDLG